MASSACYHCGDLVAEGLDYGLSIQGEIRPMCCPGCRAVAQLITSSGLENFYQHRTAFNERPNQAELDSPKHYDLYNDPEVNRSFTRQDESGSTHARLLIGGITCAACTWLIEQTLSRLPGVETATVNLGQSRLDIAFDQQRIALGDIFQRVDQLGYKSRPFHSNIQREQLAAEHKTGLRQLAVAGLGMMQVGMFAIALHAGDLQGIETEYQQLLRWVSMLVASFVVIYSARPFFSSAWRHLKVGALVMDLPVSLAIGIAWLASLFATVTGQGQVYFDSVVMFTFFLLLGRFLERTARTRHQLAWVDAESNLPSAVKVMRDQGWEEVARQHVSPGELILIPMAETVPADAIIVQGKSAIDESAFNGEHLPRHVCSGDTIYAGTVNTESAIQARVRGTYVDTRLAALQRSVEYAQLEKPALARLADVIASRFIGLILLATAATAIAWLVIDPSRALWISLSVLVISCPCALALATPAALTAAANGLRRAGIIVRGENALEALAGCSHLLFDKTGTLTEGQLQISEVQPLSTLSSTEVLKLAAALQAFSGHPLATAFAQISTDLVFEQADYHIGAGLEGQLNSQTYRIGSREFCARLAPALPAPPGDNRYWIALCREDIPLAWFALEDTVREESGEVVAAALDNGLQVELLTGDTSLQGPVLAERLGIVKIQKGVSPQQKMEYVRELQHNGAIVAMVGDGLNDAPVLGVADASFAVASATELARTQADFILLEGDLHAVNHTWATARQCRRIIRQNLGWALGYNLCGIPLAAMGYIPPWMAAIGMSASSLLVVLNSLRLNTRQPN